MYLTSSVSRDPSGTPRNDIRAFYTSRQSMTIDACVFFRLEAPRRLDLEFHAVVTGLDCERAEGFHEIAVAGAALMAVVRGDDPRVVGEPIEFPQPLDHSNTLRDVQMAVVFGAIKAFRALDNQRVDQLPPQEFAGLVKPNARV